MDCAPGSLLTLFQILDTHRRRLLRGILDPRTARTFIKFDPGIVYQPLPDGGMRIKYVPRAYSSLESVRVNVRGVA